MYIIIKKDSAEHLSDKLRKVKEIACEVMEELEFAAEREFSHEEALRHSYSRRSRDLEHGRERGRDWDDFDRDYTRGRSYSRSRY